MREQIKSWVLGEGKERVAGYAKKENTSISEIVKRWMKIGCKVENPEDPPLNL
jgi:hypothetical protein|tara:strand:+ start:2672 stop:2830 length:159 start_codon:yes stop_codon:yes gene_type:complete